MGLSFETNLKTVNVIHDSVLFTKYIVSEKDVKYLTYTTFKRMYYGRNKLWVEFCNGTFCWRSPWALRYGFNIMSVSMYVCCCRCKDPRLARKLIDWFWWNCPAGQNTNTRRAFFSNLKNRTRFWPNISILSKFVGIVFKNPHCGPHLRASYFGFKAQIIIIQQALWVAFGRKDMFSTPFHPNTAQPQPLDRFKQTFQQKLQISVLWCTSKLELWKCCLKEALCSNK